jgi:diaminohydroxyphosphoribosylaminopyrimidine deaminase/5-amino-6-(5-phosphoribosylamino)uracil reductase
LIAAGIKKVVVAMRDPFPQVRGRGAAELRCAGIAVQMGLMEAEAARLNAPYVKRLRTGRPWVLLKWAQSLDGKLATRTRDSKWISSEMSRRWVHQLRGQMDGIIVGVGTVLADDPQLTCRFGRPQRVATRMILDPTLHTPLTAQVVRTAKQIPTWIITTDKTIKSPRAQNYIKKGVTLFGIPSNRNGFDLGRLLDLLGDCGMTNVLVEGGSDTLGRFYDAGLADEALVYVSPRLIGGIDAIPALGGKGLARVQDARTVGTHMASCDGDEVFHFIWTDPPT